MKTTTAPAGNKTRSQVKAIWALAWKKGMSDEQLHLLVEAETGNPSIRALNKQNADKVISALGGKPQFKSKPRRTRQDHHQQTGTRQIVGGTQLELINSLAAKRGWNDDSLKKFCQRMLRKDAPTTTKQANTIIEALKSMNQRNNL